MPVKYNVVERKNLLDKTVVFEFILVLQKSIAKSL